MIKNKGLNQAFYYGIGILMMKSVSLLMLPIVTLYLSPAQYGSLELVLSISNFATILVGFGLVDALYRFVGLSNNKTEETNIIANILCIAIIIGIASLVIGLSISDFLVAHFVTGISLFDMQLVVVMFSIEGCIAIPLAWLRMKEQAGSFFILTTSKAIIQAIISWQLLIAGYGITAILIAGVASALMLMITLIFLQLRDTGLKFNQDKIHQVLLYGCPLVISGLAAFALIGADRWIIASFSSDTELGLYALGKKMASITLILMQPFCMWWHARRFKELKQENGLKKVSHFSSMGIALVMCCATVICLLSPLFIKFMINSQYSDALKFIPLLAIFYVVKQTSDLINLGAYLGKTTWNVMSIDLITAMISLSLSFFLSQYLNIFGVILALISAQLIRGILFYISSQKALKLHYAWQKLCFLAILCSAFVVASTHINTVTNHIIFSIAVCFLLLVFMKLSQFLTFNNQFFCKGKIINPSQEQC